MGKKSKHAASKDWKGKHFLFYSLAVTAVSIMFFFAGQYVYHKIKATEQHPREGILSKIAKLSGMTVEKVNLDLKFDDPSLEQSLFVEELKRQVEALKGEMILSIDVGKLASEIDALTWTESISVRRRLPDTLYVEVSARTPRMALRSEEGWVLADRHGVLVFSSQSLRGRWLHLPQVLGLEPELVGETAAMNRRLERERAWLSDLAKLIDTLEGRVLVRVNEARIHRSEWFGEAIFELSWKDANKREVRAKFREGNWEERIRSLQFILSDLHADSFQSLEIMGQYESKWFVKQRAEGE